jgi:hypothetical protein
MELPIRRTLTCAVLLVRECDASSANDTRNLKIFTSCFCMHGIDKQYLHTSHSVSEPAVLPLYCTIISAHNDWFTPILNLRNLQHVPNGL